MLSCRFLPHPDTLEVRSSCLTHGTVAINAVYVAYYMESTVRDLQQNARAAKRTHSRSVGLDLASATGKEAYPTNYFDSECPEIDPDSAGSSSYSTACRYSGMSVTPVSVQAYLTRFSKSASFSRCLSDKEKEVAPSLTIF